MVAAIADPGPHGRLAVKLDGSPQRLQRGPGHAHRGRSERGWLHPDLGGEPVEHRAHLQLDPGLFACYRPGTASNFVVYMSEADNVYDPLYGSFVGDQCLEHGQDDSAERSCEAALWGASRRRACPTRRQERWTSTASRSWTQP